MGVINSSKRIGVIHEIEADQPRYQRMYANKKNRTKADRLCSLMTSTLALTVSKTCPIESDCRPVKRKGHIVNGNEKSKLNSTQVAETDDRLIRQQGNQKSLLRRNAWHE